MLQQHQNKKKGIFKVFVSSAFKDLEKERKEIRKTIDSITLESIGMESFVPSEQDSHQTSLDNLKISDIYLLLIGEKYGSRVNKCEIPCNLKNSICNKSISYTCCEFRNALNRDIPVICFKLSNDKAPDEDLKNSIKEVKDKFYVKLIKKKNIAKEVEKALEDLKNFIKEVEDKFYVKPIKKEDIAKEVEKALKENIRRWICEGKLNLPDFYGRKEEIKELFDAFDKYSTIFVKGIGGIGKTTLIEAFLLAKKIEGANILETVREKDYNRTDIGYKFARDVLEIKEYKSLDLKELAKILGIPLQATDKDIIDSIINSLNNRNLILFIDDAQEIKDERVFDLISRCTNSLTSGKIILAGREDLKINTAKTLPVEKGVKDDNFIMSIFRENGKVWNPEISGKIMNITLGHPLAVKLVVRNIDYIGDISKFENILKNAYDEKQVDEFIRRVTKEILINDFEKIVPLSVHRIPFSLMDKREANELIAKMIIEKINGKYFFTSDLIQEVLYASINDKKQAHKKASDYYKNFMKNSNYKEFAEYLYHLAKSGDKDAYNKYLEYDDILSKQGFYKELIDINEIFLKNFIEINDNDKKLECYTNIGISHYNLGNFKKAIEYHKKALEISLKIGNKVGESACYINLGVVYRNLGYFKKAIEHYEQALEIDLKIGDKSGESKCYRNLGVVYGNLRNFGKSTEYHKKSLEIALKLGDKTGKSSCYINLGIVQWNLGKTKEAIEYYKKALKIDLEIRDRGMETSCYINLGNAYVSLGDFKKAIEYHEKALEIAKMIGNRAGESKCYGNLSIAYANLGDFEKAIRYNKKALKIALDIGDKSEESACYINLGFNYRNLGYFKKAIEHYEQALEIDLKIGDKSGESKCYRNLGVAYYSKGNFNKGMEYYKKSLEITLEIGDKLGESKDYVNLGIAYRKLKNFKKAIEYHEKALKIKLKIGNKAGESVCYANLGKVYSDLGDFKKAIEYHEKALEIAIELGDQAIELVCYADLGNIYYNNLEDFERAIEYYLEAEKIFKKIKQKHYSEIIYGNMAIIYKKMGRNEKAKEYKRKVGEI